MIIMEEWIFEHIDIDLSTTVKMWHDTARLCEYLLLFGKINKVIKLNER